MNLFLLAIDPRENAEMHCDQHVVKMILEATQVMCSVLHIDKALGTYTPRALTKDESRLVRESSVQTPQWYKPTHVNHPLVIWARTSLENFLFVKQYALALTEEYKFRFQKLSHRSGELCASLPIPKYIPQFHPSPITFVTCMPDEFRIDISDPVACYREFYKKSKSTFAKYRHRHPPKWLPFTMDNQNILS